MEVASAVKEFLVANLMLPTGDVPQRVYELREGEAKPFVGDTALSFISPFYLVVS